MSVADAHGSSNGGDLGRSFSKDTVTTAVPENTSTADVEKPSKIDVPDPAPDGGFWAWLQVFSVFWLFFNAWGSINAFGAFQTYYAGTLGKSASDISWIGTFQGFLLLLVGSLAGPLFDKGYLRSLMAVGIFAMVFGYMMTSLSTQYYQVFLAQGVLIGFGAGCVFVPGLAILGQYFTARKALAVGIAAAGGSIGALLFPIIFSRLQVEVDFGWATRTIGFITLGTLLTTAATIRPRLQPAEARALFDKTALRNGPFVLVTLGVFCYFLGVYLPFFYMAPWAEQALGTDSGTAFYLYSILNAGSVLGRILPGLLADRLGSLNVIIVACLASGGLLFAWAAGDVSSFGRLVAFCVLYGFFSGGTVSLPGAVLFAIAPQPRVVGTWVGMSLGFASFGFLVGNPIAGAIIAARGYPAAQAFAGAMALGGAVLLALARLVTWRKNGKWKA